MDSRDDSDADDHSQNEDEQELDGTVWSREQVRRDMLTANRASGAR
jgi:hypothetical protein